RVRELAEPEGRRGGLLAELRRVIAVVEAEADDLLGVVHGGREPNARQGETPLRLACSLGERGATGFVQRADQAPTPAPGRREPHAPAVTMHSAMRVASGAEREEQQAQASAGLEPRGLTTQLTCRLRRPPQEGRKRVGR